MLYPPKTLEEARKYRYNRWGGNPQGTAYKEGFCAYSVYDAHLSYQCRHKNGKGINGLYCGIHAKRVKE